MATTRLKAKKSSRSKPKQSVIAIALDIELLEIMRERKRELGIPLSFQANAALREYLGNPASA